MQAALEADLSPLLLTLKEYRFPAWKSIVSHDAIMEEYRFP